MPLWKVGAEENQNLLNLLSLWKPIDFCIQYCNISNIFQIFQIFLNVSDQWPFGKLPKESWCKPESEPFELAAFVQTKRLKDNCIEYCIDIFITKSYV